MFIVVCGLAGGYPDDHNHGSGTLLHELTRWLSDEFGKPDQVVCSATEYEQPVHLRESSQLDLAQRASLFQPAKALLDQPTPAQANRVAGLPCGSAVQIAATALVVLRNMGCHIQLPHRAHKIVAVIGLVGAHRDPPLTTVLLLLQHQQCCVALGVSIGVRHHRRGNQPVAVLHQRVAQIAQLGLLAIALLVQPRIRISGRFMRLVGTLLATEIRAVAVIGVVFAAKALLRCPRLDQ